MTRISLIIRRLYDKDLEVIFFHANIEPYRFYNQWLDWGVWHIWSLAIFPFDLETKYLVWEANNLLF